MKYVIVQHPTLSVEVPIILPDCVSHDEAKKIGVPMSAGYCKFTDDGGVETYAHSHSLGMQPRREDADIITMYMVGRTERIPA